MNRTSRFSFYTLILAGVYNILWGAIAIFAPTQSLNFFGIQDVNYPQFWQCIGMIVGVYGLGYLIAATDVARHWPIVLVGFLGKIFGPIGFAENVYLGVFPIKFGINIIFNDLIWWIPFYLVLKEAYDVSRQQFLEGPSRPISSLLNENDKKLILMLRHQGCTFTRNLLSQLSENFSAIEKSGAELVLVHMGEDKEFRQLLSNYFSGAEMNKVTLVSDPQQAYYRDRELGRGNLIKMFGLQEFIKGTKAFFKGAGLGPLRGDGLQLSGIFLYAGQNLVKEFRSQRASSEFPIEKWFN